MAKRIVVLSDGTWNEGADSETNIHLLNEMLVRDDRQIVHYDSGVGTDWYNKKSGGALGVGLSRNVRQLYEKVLGDYEPGDDVFCFGFSRGAFTVRSLAGFMNLVGRLQSKGEIDEAYFYYRIHEPGENDNFIEQSFKPRSEGPLPVRFLGVFDTVGSLGVPLEIDDDDLTLSNSFVDAVRNRLKKGLDRLGDRLRRPIKGFHDTSLGGNVEEAWHAVAIDEQRQSFRPTMWTEAPGKAFKVSADGTLDNVRQTVEQAWFVGAHGDVGGGYTDLPRPIRLSNMPLLWMIEAASTAGLEIKPGAVETLRQGASMLTTVPQNDSLTKLWRKLHHVADKAPLLRPIGNEARRRIDPSGDDFPEVKTSEWIHPSVEKRLGRDVELRSSDRPNSPTRLIYDPANLVRSMIGKDQDALTS